MENGFPPCIYREVYFLIMLYPITDTELDQLCYYLTQTPYIYYPQTQTFLTDLYNTGCRPNELLEIDRWNYVSSSQIELTVEKQGTIRTFTESDLSSDLLFAIQNNLGPYGNLTLRQLTWVEKKILPVPQVQTTDRSAITYIFRYNYIKKLHNSGKTDDQIREIMSWSPTFEPSIYYNQNLFTTEVLPPLPPIPSDMPIIYGGRISQSGTSNPIVTELWNTVGTVNAVRYGAGAYQLEKSGGWSSNIIILLGTNSTLLIPRPEILIYRFLTGDVVINTLSSGSQADDQLVDLSFAILQP